MSDLPSPRPDGEVRCPRRDVHLCNPPFGPEAGRWLDRMADHGHGIALCPARTETRWFVNTVWRRASSVLFLHGRPHFHYPAGTRGKANSGAPIVLVAYGPTADARLAESGLRGSLVTRPAPAAPAGDDRTPDTPPRTDER